MSHLIKALLFFAVYLSLKCYATEVLKTNIINEIMIEKINSFQKKYPTQCSFIVKDEAPGFSIGYPSIRGIPFVFYVPDKTMLKILENSNPHSECKLENQTIKCKSEELGQMPEHITQSYQHLELKLDKTGNIVNMHAYKIQKSFLFNKELKHLEKKYSEFYCPPKEQASKDQEINDSTIVKTKNTEGKESTEISNSSGSTSKAQ